MDVRKQIAVLDLLRQREAEFVRVWQCEEGVRRLLDLSDFPFAPVPYLPSREKRHGGIRLAGVRDGHAVAAATGVSVPPLRGLFNGEDAYHLVFECDGEPQASFQSDVALIRQLFQLPGDHFRMLKIETVVFRSLEDWEVRELLWERKPGG